MATIRSYPVRFGAMCVTSFVVGSLTGCGVLPWLRDARNVPEVVVGILVGCTVWALIVAAVMVYPFYPHGVAGSLSRAATKQEIALWDGRRKLPLYRKDPPGSENPVVSPEEVELLLGSYDPGKPPNIEPPTEDQLTPQVAPVNLDKLRDMMSRVLASVKILHLYEVAVGEEVRKLACGSIDDAKSICEAWERDGLKPGEPKLAGEVYYTPDDPELEQ